MNGQIKRTLMPDSRRKLFDPARFLTAAGVPHRMIQVKAGHIFFSQGAHADWVFFLDSGRAKLTVVSQRGKEATITLLVTGDFIGQESLAGISEIHIATAEAETHVKL
jgi:CRP-like cAMP-binding protein